MSMGNTPNKSKENPSVENPAQFGGGAYPPPVAGGAYPPPVAGWAYPSAAVGGAYPPPPSGPPPAYSLDGDTTSPSAPAYWVKKTLGKLALTNLKSNFVNRFNSLENLLANMKIE